MMAAVRADAVADVVQEERGSWVLAESKIGGELRGRVDLRSVKHE
jgi:hypothetical protein